MMSQSIQSKAAAPAAEINRTALPSGHYLLLAVAWLAFVIYGSLMPFDFRAAGTPDTSLPLRALHWSYLAASSPKWWDSATITKMNNVGESSIMGDYVINLMLYLPIGMLLRLRLHRLGKSWWRQIVEPTLLILGTCWAVECSQGMVTSRLASYNDVLMNTAGGIAGVLTAVLADAWLRHAIFWAYCKISYAAFGVRDFVSRQREKPVMLIVVTVLNLAMFGVWCKLHMDQGKLAGKRAINWMPFHDQFSYPYEIALAHLARSMILYVLIAMLLSLQFLSYQRRRGVGFMVLAVALLAGVNEAVRATTAGRRADVTEPLVAMIAVVCVVFLGYLMMNSVRSCCRRKEQVFVGVDRRRRAHNYDASNRAAAPGDAPAAMPVAAKK
ncbi:MAG: VanZ family protein [Planctomycetes bacterium]|nr:VanZ family protein [Planctomycetota bacterium]